MARNKRIHKRTTSTVEPKPEDDQLIAPDNSTLCPPEESIVFLNDQVPAPLDKPIDVSVQSSSKLMPADDRMATSQIPIAAGLEVSQGTPKIDSPSSDVHPVTEHSLAEEETSNNSLPELTNEIPHEVVQTNTTSLHIEPEECKVDPLQELNSNPTIDAPISEKAIIGSSSEELTGKESTDRLFAEESSAEVHTNIISVEQSIAENIIETKTEGPHISDVTSSVPAEHDFTISPDIEESFVKSPEAQVSTFIEDPISNGNYDGQTPREALEALETAEPASTFVSLSEESDKIMPSKASVFSELEGNSGDICLEEGSSQLSVHSDVTKLATEVPTTEFTKNNSSEVSLLSKAEDQKPEIILLASELSEVDTLPEITSEIMTEQSIEKAPSECDEKSSIEEVCVASVVPATTELSPVEALANEEIAKETSSENLDTIESEQNPLLLLASEVLVGKSSNEDSIASESTEMPSIDSTPPFEPTEMSLAEVKAAVNTTEEVFDASDVLESNDKVLPDASTLESPVGSHEADIASESATPSAPSDLTGPEPIVLKSVERISELPVEEDAMEGSLVKASFVAEKSAVETFVAELVEQPPAENSLFDKVISETYPAEAYIDLEHIAQTEVEEPTKQDIAEVDTKSGSDLASIEKPLSVVTITEDLPIEVPKPQESSEFTTTETTEQELLDSPTFSGPIHQVFADEPKERSAQASDLPVPATPVVESLVKGKAATISEVASEPVTPIEQELLDSPTFSDHIHQVSADVPKEKSAQASDLPVSVTPAAESLVKDKPSITQEAVSEPVETTTRDVNPEETNPITPPTTETDPANNQDSSLESTQTKAPSKIEGYKKFLKGAFQMSIGSLFRRRSLKARGKENKIDGKLEVEVAHASGNIQTSTVQ